MLQYSNGYANVTSSAYTMVPHTQTWQACATACASDSSCLAWTRVAGGCLPCPLIGSPNHRFALLALMHATTAGSRLVLAGIGAGVRA